MQRRSPDRVSISHIASILSEIFLLFVRSDCVFGRRKWKLLQIMASASHPAKQKKQQVMGFKWMNITRCRSSPFDKQPIATEWLNWMVFPAILPPTEKYKCKKKPCENWRSTPFRFHMQCISFPSNSFRLCSGSKVHTANGGKREKMTECRLCLCLHTLGSRNNNSASMCQQPKTNRR